MLFQIRDFTAGEFLEKPKFWGMVRRVWSTRDYVTDVILNEEQYPGSGTLGEFKSVGMIHQMCEDYWFRVVCPD